MKGTISPATANFSFKAGKSSQYSNLMDKVSPASNSSHSRKSLSFNRVLNQKLPQLDPSELIKRHIGLSDEVAGAPTESFDGTVI